MLFRQLYPLIDEDALFVSVEVLFYLSFNLFADVIWRRTEFERDALLDWSSDLAETLNVWVWILHVHIVGHGLGFLFLLS